MYYRDWDEMSQKDNQAPKIVSSVNDMIWFESVLNSSRQALAAAPDDSKPSWYRQYEAEEAIEKTRR